MRYQLMEVDIQLPGERAHTFILLYLSAFMQTLSFILVAHLLTCIAFRIGSCSDNGTVVVSTVGLGVDDKDTVIHFNQSMKAVCIENDSVAKKDKSFLVGELKWIFALLALLF
jgi:hypothetical protein